MRLIILLRIQDMVTRPVLQALMDRRKHRARCAHQVRQVLADPPMDVVILAIDLPRRSAEDHHVSDLCETLEETKMANRESSERSSPARFRQSFPRRRSQRPERPKRPQRP